MYFRFLRLPKIMKSSDVKKIIPIQCVKFKYRNVSLYFDQNDIYKTLNNFILYLMQTKINALRFCNLLKITYPCLSSYRLNISIDGGHFQQFYCSFTFRKYDFDGIDNICNLIHFFLSHAIFIVYVDYL